MPAAYVDVTNLAKTLQLAGDRAQPVVAGIIRAAAYEIQAEAKQNAPKRTGALSSSISVSFDGPMHAEIGPTVPYGGFQEFGTRGPYKIRPRRPGGRLVFQVNGTTVFAKEVTHPGLKANPYMRPASEAVVENLVRRVGSAGVKLIVSPDANTT